jgi:HTH-type transcriptional regulator / antitoxin HigA
LEEKIMTTTAQKNKIVHSADLPDNFLMLQERMMVLRPIHNPSDYKKAMRVVEMLAPRNDLTPAQADYLEILANNIAAYEKSRASVSHHNPVELLKFLLEENGMTGSDLGRLLGNRSLGHAILSGRRTLSKAHIAKLSEHFAISPAAFLSAV